MPDKNWQFELEEYIKQGEPDRAEKSEAWQTAIGLQAVDGLSTSEYLLDTAKDHIEGKISIDEAQKRICSYYEQRTVRTEAESETKEAEYFRNALVRANYTNLQKGIHSTTKYLELFFANLLLGTNHELKNRYMHVDYVEKDTSQSINSKVPKYQFDTLECSLEELAVLEIVTNNPDIKQQELVSATGKSIATVKRIMKSLQDKNYIRRENGKRYGKWEVLV